MKNQWDNAGQGLTISFVLTALGALAYAGSLAIRHGIKESHFYEGMDNCFSPINHTQICSAVTPDEQTQPLIDHENAENMANSVQEIPYQRLA